MKSPHLLISSHPLLQTHMHARKHKTGEIGQFVHKIQGPGFKSQSWEKRGRNSKLTGEMTVKSLLPYKRAKGYDVG